jgi:hypothetical protein
MYSASAFVMMVLSAVSAAAGAGGAGTRALGSGRGLFFDDGLIQSVRGTRLQLHSPACREVVLTFDAAWEGGQSGYMTVCRAPEGYRLYYRGGGDLGREYTCVAFSKDAIHWTRPSLKLVEFRGSNDNNIFWTGKERKAYCESHNFSPFKDLNPAARPDEAWKAVSSTRLERGGKNVLVGFVSPDGIHWRRVRSEPLITQGAFDSQNVAFWDVVARRYVCYSREAQQGKRSVNRCTSPDFLNWTRPELLDFGSSPVEHFYTNGIVQYERQPEVYIGLPMRFIPPQERDRVGFEPRRTDGLSDAVFISSHDGMHWNRPFMEAFIRPGPDPLNWGGAHGNSTPAWGVLQTSATELSVFWAEHYDNYPADKIIPRLVRGTLRLDGFVSVNAPYTGGEFTTHPFTFTGRQLVLNCSTSAVGTIQVEIQDGEGKPVSGHALEECPEIWGDEMERKVGWKTGADVGALAGKPVRLRFRMKDADLYSFQFQP